MPVVMTQLSLEVHLTGHETIMTNNQNDSSSILQSGSSYLNFATFLLLTPPDKCASVTMILCLTQYSLSGRTMQVSELSIQLFCYAIYQSKSFSVTIFNINSLRVILLM